MTKNTLKNLPLDSKADYSQTFFVNEQPHPFDELSANFDPILEPEIINILRKNYNSLSSNRKKLANPTQPTIIDIDCYRELF